MEYECPSSQALNAVGSGPVPSAPEAKLPGSSPAALRPEDLSNRALLSLLTELVQELELRSKMHLGAFRDEFECTISDATTELEKLTPGRQKRTVPVDDSPKSGLSPAKLKAVRAACGAGVPLGQVAKHFGLSRADIRKALAEPE